MKNSVKIKYNLKFNSKKRFALSNSICISTNESNKLVGYISLSRPLKELSMRDLAILYSFTKPNTIEGAYNLLKDNFPIVPHQFLTLVKSLLALAFLIDAKYKKSTPAAQGTFSSLTMHLIMLKDIPRVMSYKTAIQEIVKDKTVIDLGCGTGLLSMLSAKAGAKLVYAIEESSIAEIANLTFRENKISNKIRLYNCNSKDVSLRRKADVLIHEILGNDPFEENLLLYIQDAKKRLLKPNAKMIPFKIQSFCLGYQDEWNANLKKEMKELANLYGLKFNEYSEQLQNEINMNYQQKVGTRPLLANKHFISEECIIHDLNLYSKLAVLRDLNKVIKLKITKTGLMHGLIIYFKAFLTPEIILTNSPFAPSTHWIQKFVPFEKGITVKTGMEILIKVYIVSKNGIHNLQAELV